VQATLHWVAAASAVPAQVRLYSHLFTRADPGATSGGDLNMEPLSFTEAILDPPTTVSLLLKT